jgi:hypothetical protein
MLNRRGFLTGMTALTGGYILTACGGGGGGGSAPTSPGVAAGANLSPQAGSSAAGASAPGGAGSNMSGSGTAPPDVPASQPADSGSNSSSNSGSDSGSNSGSISTQPIFYGINGHYDYPWSPAQTVSMLKALNCTLYRLACTSDPVSLNPVVNMAKGFVDTGITLFTCIDHGIVDASGVVFANETIAYNEGFANGAAIAAALMPYGVTMYECGNELTRVSEIVIDSSCAGNKVTDFNNAYWPVMRGMMRGLMEGVKSVQPSARCGINFTVADIGASDALWNGTQPDGTTGHQPLRWDITTWHNYEVYGDIFNIGTDGDGPRFDLPAYCKAAYGVPFMITEWNANPEDGQQFRADYITQHLGEFYAKRKTDDIESVMYYELASGDTTWGVVLADGSVIDPEYSALKNFPVTHPDN